MKKRNIILKFFDKLEDLIRGGLSKVPIIYAFIGGVSIVLFWRGVWHTADLFVPFFFRNASPETFFLAQILDAPITIIIASLLLLATGLMVSHFIGNEIIISGIKHEKKLEEKEAEEIETEEYILHTMMGEIKKIREDLDLIKNKLKD